MKKTKVYIYTRASTAIQIDGYSLDVQKSGMKALCDYNDYEIAGDYEDGIGRKFYYDFTVCGFLSISKKCIWWMGAS